LISKYPEADVVVTGHSLGGAIAVLGAMDLTVNYGIKAHLYTYG